MATIISMAKWKNNKRAESIVAEREQQAAIAINDHSAKAADAFLSGNLLESFEHIERVVELQNPKPCPVAYCDPHNEWQGSKYQATKHLSVSDLPALMREDIKAAKKAGRIHKDFKVSVRKESCTHSWSIEIKITQLPEGISIYTPEYIAATNNLNEPAPWGEFRKNHEVYTPEVTKALDVLKEIHGAYNRDNSDSMSDYFDVRYYGDAGIHWELK